jgi:hypothetical protein
MLPGYCQGENLQGCMKEVVKNCTPGVTAPMVSRHLGTERAAWRALGGGDDRWGEWLRV